MDGKTVAHLELNLGGAAAGVRMRADLDKDGIIAHQSRMVYGIRRAQGYTACLLVRRGQF